MTCIAFILSVLFTGAIASLVNVDTGTSRPNQPDYHFVPFAGDALGA